MKRLISLVLTALAVACGSESKVPSGGVLSALAQSATVSGLYAVVVNRGGAAESYSGDPQPIDPSGFTIDFQDMPSNGGEINVVILGDIGGDLMPLIAWQPAGGLGGSGDFRELDGDGQWVLPLENGTYDYDLDDDLASNFAEVLGNLEPRSQWTTVASGLSIAGMTGSRAESMLIATTSGFRYPGDLTVPKYLSTVTTARNLAAPTPRNATVSGDPTCAANVTPRSLDVDLDTVFVGGGGGCIYSTAGNALTEGAPSINVKAYASGVSTTWSAIAYFGTPYIATVADTGAVYSRNTSSGDLAGTSLGMNARAALPSGYFWIDMPQTQSQAGIDPLIAASQTQITLVNAGGGTDACVLDNATLLEGTTHIERAVTLSGNINSGFNAYVVYRRPSSEKVVRRLRFTVSVAGYAGCAGVTVAPDPVVVLPAMGNVTAMVVGVVDAVPSSETGGRSLYIGDDAGNVVVVESSDSWNTSTTARLLGQLPNGQAVKTMTIPSDAGIGSEPLLRSLFVATPGAAYRLP